VALTLSSLADCKRERLASRGRMLACALLQLRAFGARAIAFGERVAGGEQVTTGM
jgi:hypothetical protein